MRPWILAENDATSRKLRRCRRAKGTLGRHSHIDQKQNLGDHVEVLRVGANRKGDASGHDIFNELIHSARKIMGMPCIDRRRQGQIDLGSLKHRELFVSKEQSVLDATHPLPYALLQGRPAVAVRVDHQAILMGGLAYGPELFASKKRRDCLGSGLQAGASRKNLNEVRACTGVLADRSGNRQWSPDSESEKIRTRASPRRYSSEGDGYPEGTGFPRHENRSAHVPKFYHSGADSLYRVFAPLAGVPEKVNMRIPKATYCPQRRPNCGSAGL